jgi:hypothetical protein
MRLTVSISLALGVLFAVVISAGAGLAASCTSDAQCPNDLVCQPALVPGTKECKELRCNFDSDCPADRGTCEGGSCSASGSGGAAGGSSGGSSSGPVGGTLAGEGQVCGPHKIGQVTKSIACKHGLQCLQGICRKPAA